MTRPPLYIDRETIVLTKNGLWLSDGQEITHESTIQAFSKNLRREKDGWWIRIGRDAKKIEVEDTAWFVRRIDRLPENFHGNSQIEILLTDGTRELLNPDTLSYRPGRLTCRVKPGRVEEAKFLQSPYFDLLKDIEEDEEGYFLKFGTLKICLAHRRAETLR